ncbi:MAG: hypothetical protein EAY75_12545 [Bacteroidetes bacterium]|nr:MAG: hypothetical protein EAY75_12545 [Bacteroidota bacterium]
MAKPYGRGSPWALVMLLGKVQADLSNRELLMRPRWLTAATRGTGPTLSRRKPAAQAPTKAPTTKTCH